MFDYDSWKPCFTEDSHDLFLRFSDSLGYIYPTDIDFKLYASTALARLIYQNLCDILYNDNKKDYCCFIDNTGNFRTYTFDANFRAELESLKDEAHRYGYR